MGDWNVTIKDILTRDIFKKAILIAGEKGLDREIKWTHILEMESFDSFINGGELILTTGSNIQLDSHTGIPKLKSLIDQNVAGICIELGTHVKEITPEIITFANQRDFPIIVFNEVVKFVDITQDLHTLIINHHHQKLTQLHSLSNEFNDLSIKPNGIMKIINKLYKVFHTAIILITDEQKKFYYPPHIKERAEVIPSNSLDMEANKEIVIKNECYTAFPIKALGQSWGNLYLQNKRIELDEFSFSIIDRASLAIAQILLRNRTIEVRKQSQEEDIVQRLLQDANYDESLALKILPAAAKNLGYRLILFEKNTPTEKSNDEEWEEVKLQQSIILRSLFKKYGFFPAISITKNEIAVIASFYQNENIGKRKENFTQIVHEIKKVQEKNVFDGTKYFIGISSLQQRYAKLVNSYNEAKEVLLLQKKEIVKSYFYEEMGVFRLLSKVNHKDLDAYTSNYLGPLIDYEKETDGDLFSTLSIYLETMGSKKETAERLYIVRQTLYHRLEKIKELLGEDFLEPTNRQAIELAIRIHQLINTNSHRN